MFSYILFQWNFTKFARQCPEFKGFDVNSNKIKFHDLAEPPPPSPSNLLLAGLPKDQALHRLHQVFTKYTHSKSSLKRTDWRIFALLNNKTVFEW